MKSLNIWKRMTEGGKIIFYLVGLLICISSWIVVSGQEKKVSRMSKSITYKKDTLNKKVVEQAIFKYQPDSAFIKTQIRQAEILDSIINLKKKK